MAKGLGRPMNTAVSLSCSSGRSDPAGFFTVKCRRALPHAAARLHGTPRARGDSMLARTLFFGSRGFGTGPASTAGCLVVTENGAYSFFSPYCVKYLASRIRDLTSRKLRAMDRGMQNRALKIPTSGCIKVE
jgi:hypothetical protein